MPATQERSAGFIIFHVEPGEGVIADRTRFLLLDYGRFWDFPKGHVEAGETDLQAARRELQEETGLHDIEVVEGFTREITYFFRHSRRGLIRKTVVFFAARSNSKQVTLSSEHAGHAWLFLADAIKRATYASAREVLKQAASAMEQT